MPPRRSCNTRLLSDTIKTYRGTAHHLPKPAKVRVAKALRAAETAAKAGRCADMHKHAQTARETLNTRIDELLGTSRRRRR